MIENCDLNSGQKKKKNGAARTVQSCVVCSTVLSSVLCVVRWRLKLLALSPPTLPVKDTLMVIKWQTKK